MGKERWLLAGLAGLGLFAAGYLSGRQSAGESGSNLSSLTHAARLPDRRDLSGPLPERTRARPAQRPADEKHSTYGKIVDMVSRGELRISGVEINTGNFLPGDKVAEFFGLSSEQLAEMKRIGLDRLREKQNRIESLAKIRTVSETGMVFDLPADPEFATAEAARFTEDIRKGFGPDVAAMLQPSISHAYDGFTIPRHVRYTLTKRDDLPASAPENIRAMHQEMYDYKISINQNEDGSYMRGEQGQFLGVGSEGGSVDLNDTEPESFRPPYHYLWERKMGRR